MTGKNTGDEEFGEFTGLAGLLGRIDPSAQSRVRDSLKERLLNRAAERARPRPFARLWLLPAAAAVLAALFLTTDIRRGAPAAAAYLPSYDVPSDGYAECGRRGLGNYLSETRF